MASDTSNNVSIVLASIVGVPVWGLLLILTSGGPYWGSSGGTAWLFFLAPIPLVSRMFASGSRALGAWLFALSPIINSIFLLFLALASNGLGIATGYGDITTFIAFALIWWLPLISMGENGHKTESAVEDSQSASVETGFGETSVRQSVLRNQNGDSKNE